MKWNPERYGMKMPIKDPITRTCYWAFDCVNVEQWGNNEWKTHPKRAVQKRLPPGEVVLCLKRKQRQSHEERECDNDGLEHSDGIIDRRHSRNWMGFKEREHGKEIANDLGLVHRRIQTSRYKDNVTNWSESLFSSKWEPRERWSSQGTRQRASMGSVAPKLPQKEQPCISQTTTLSSQVELTE